MPPLYLLTPEILLIAAAVAIYLGGAFFATRRLWCWAAGGAIALAATALWMQHGPSIRCESLVLDGLAWYVRWLALGFAALLTLLHARPCPTHNESETMGSLLLSIAGLMLVAEAADLVLLFVGLELISIPTYVLLYVGRSDRACQESAAKYFYLSVLASSMLLYGFSFLYGVSGSTELTAARAAFEGVSETQLAFGPFAKLAVVLIFAGLSFKIAAVPFHFYAPDVYQGTTHPNAAFLSIVPKAAGLTAMVRLLVVTMPGVEPYCWWIAFVLSFFTMTFGNVMALWQDDLRRLLAYSAIAHSGYMLMALSAGMVAPSATAWNGIAAMWFYLAVYAVATLGAFAVFESLGRSDRRIDAVDELAGLAQTCPRTAALLAVFMFSLAGVPPLAGFWGKFLVFGSALNVGDAGPGSALRPWFIGLAVLGVLNAAVAATYYLRIVAVMYFRAPLATLRPAGGRAALWAAVACAAVVIAVGAYSSPLIKASNAAVGNTVLKQEQAVKQEQADKPVEQPAVKDSAASPSITPGMDRLTLGIGNEITVSDLCSHGLLSNLPRRGAVLPAQGNALGRVDVASRTRPNGPIIPLRRSSRTNAFTDTREIRWENLSY